MKTAFLIAKEIHKQNKHRTSYKYTFKFKQPLYLTVNNQEGNSCVLCFKAICYVNPITQEVTVLYKVDEFKLPTRTFRSGKESFFLDVCNFFRVQRLLNQLVPTI